MTASLLTRAVHTRAFGIGVAALVLLAAVLYFSGGHSVSLTGDKGLALPSANEWIPSPAADFAAGICGSIATLVIMLLLNKVYNVLRTMTSLFIALFSVMQLATPDLLTQFYTGTAVAVVVPLCMFFLLSCYRSPESTRHIFIIFLLLSFFTATQYCYAGFVPVFLVGLGQMRIFNARSLVAALLGLLTPWWIMLGFGIITPSDIRAPYFTSIFSVIDYEDTFMLLVSIGVTAFLMLLCYVLNVLRTIAYNARARAVNGSFLVLALMTVALMCIDYRNIVSYVPMLNFCAALEVSHFFSTHRAEKSFIAIFVILAVYTAIFVCQTTI